MRSWTRTSQSAVPRPTGAGVRRAALLRRLESAGEPLVLLVAPSGFGKTSLLAEWASATGVQVAWTMARGYPFATALKTLARTEASSGLRE